MRGGSSVSDRARHVYALLRTLLAWAPSPPASRTGSVLASQQRGFVSKSRFLTCPDCLANGRPDGMHGCETCGGRGEVPDDGPDPYESKRSTRFGGVAGERVADRTRQLDDELRRLEFQLAKPDRKVDEQAGDVLTRAIVVRDYAYRRGSYAELERALARLRDYDPSMYELAMSVAYQPLKEEPIEPVRRFVVVLCELLAGWMPETIRVPAGVHVWTREELEARSREAKSALAFGRSEWASASRAERKRVILLLHGEGLSDGKIAARFGLTRQRVQQIRAGLEVVCEAGEAA